MNLDPNTHFHATESCQRSSEQNKSANKTTVITVASFYRLNSVRLQYSGLIYYFLQCTQSARITTVQLKQIGQETADQNVSSARNLRLASKHSPRLFLPHFFFAGIKQERAQKCNVFGNFYTRMSKCFDLDGYRAEKVKEKKSENRKQARLQ